MIERLMGLLAVAAAVIFAASAAIMAFAILTDPWLWQMIFNLLLLAGLLVSMAAMSFAVYLLVVIFPIMLLARVIDGRWP